MVRVWPLKLNNAAYLDVIIIPMIINVHQRMLVVKRFEWLRQAKFTGKTDLEYLLKVPIGAFYKTVSRNWFKYLIVKE